MGHSKLDHLKQFDYFGVQFNFNYTSKEKFRTIIGGLGFIIFLLIALAYSFINLIPLLKREKMSVIYYSMQLSKTDKINFQNSNFALGISSCTLLKNYTEFWDYFKLHLTYTTEIHEDGTAKKKIIEIPYGKCKYSDFNNEFNHSFDKLGLDSYFCFQNTNFTVEGTYSSDMFKFITIELKAVNSEPSTFKRIKEILKDECDFNMYALDTAFDLSNFTNPIQKYLTSNYINIKYTELMKRNTFFQLQQFDSYENYLFDNHRTKNIIGVGSVDLYSVFKDNDRLESKIEDYDTFAKIYLRAELQRKIVERRYVKLTEFAANISSILSAVLIVLFVVLTFINKFYANETVMRKIFQFNKEHQKVKKNIHFDANKTENDHFIEAIQRANILNFDDRFFNEETEK